MTFLLLATALVVLLGLFVLANWWLGGPKSQFLRFVFFVAALLCASFMGFDTGRHISVGIERRVLAEELLRPYQQLMSHLHYLASSGEDEDLRRTIRHVKAVADASPGSFPLWVATFSNTVQTAIGLSEQE